MSITPQAIHLEISKLKNLPPLPEESDQILKAINDPDIELDKLVIVLSTSPIIVARLLGLANSAFFGYAGKVTNLRSAIVKVLGLKLVKNLSLSLLLNMSLDSTKCRNFNTEQFWYEALLTAVSAQKVSFTLSNKALTPTFMYTAGLMLQIGLLTAVYIYPEEMDDLLLLEKDSDASLSELMVQYHGIDQYQLGAFLLERWKLPLVYQNILTNYNNSHYIGDELLAIGILKVSSIIVRMIVNNETDFSAEDTRLLQRIQISVEELLAIKKEVFEEMDDLCSLVQMMMVNNNEISGY